MELSQEFSSATYQIKKYEPGIIYINDQSYQNSVIVFPHRLITCWPPKQLKELTQSDFTVIFDEAKPDIVLIGTGDQLEIPSNEILQFLFDKGVGFEYMDNRSACYTYTILAAEGRNVALCILIPTADDFFG